MVEDFLIYFVMNPIKRKKLYNDQRILYLNFIALFYCLYERFMLREFDIAINTWNLEKRFLDKEKCYEKTSVSDVWIT